MDYCYFSCDANGLCLKLLLHMPTLVQWHVRLYMMHWFLWDGHQLKSDAHFLFLLVGYCAFCRDEGVHWGIQNGLHLSRSTIIYFKHNDMKSLQSILENVTHENKRAKKVRRYIVVEAVYQVFLQMHLYGKEGCRSHNALVSCFLLSIVPSLHCLCRSLNFPPN